MKRKKSRRILSVILLLLLCSGAGYLFFRGRIMPIAETMAFTIVEDRASDVIVEAIDLELQNDEADYAHLVYLDKDTDGNITALRTNMMEMNRLKVAVLNDIRTRITRLDEDSLTIAMGSLIFPEIFAGKGPGIPIRILAVSSSDAEFASNLTEAGINQTLHQIVMNVFITVTVLLPTGTHSVPTQTSVVVAETVLIGTVPSSYVNFTGQSLTEE